MTLAVWNCRIWSDYILTPVVSMFAYVYFVSLIFHDTLIMLEGWVPRQFCQYYMQVRFCKHGCNYVRIGLEPHVDDALDKLNSSNFQNIFQLWIYHLAIGKLVLKKALSLKLSSSPSMVSLILMLCPMVCIMPEPPFNGLSRK